MTFAEQSGGGLYHVLGSTRKAKGALKFHPKDSSQRRRRIIALVEQSGVPRARLPVARFRAPKPRGAAKPRRLRVARRGHGLLVRWHGVRGAHGYRVEVALPKDGRHVLRFLARKRTKLALGGIEADDVGRISVQAIGADARPGKAAKAKLKPKRKRHKHHGHKHHKA